MLVISTSSSLIPNKKSTFSWHDLYGFAIVACRQDLILGEVGAGVDRLHERAVNIHDETKVSSQCQLNEGWGRDGKMFCIPSQTGF